MSVHTGIKSQECTLTAGLHGVFVISGVLFALMDKLMSGKPDGH